MESVATSVISEVADGLHGEGPGQNSQGKRSPVLWPLVLSAEA